MAVVSFCCLKIQAQENYVLDWSDTSTWDVTCGTVNAAQWTVKNDTCWYYSPLIQIDSTGSIYKQINYGVRINQSGNLTDNDFAYIIIDTNGVHCQTDTVRGDTCSAVFTLTDSTVVTKGSTFQISIRLNTDHNTQFWQIKNGDIDAIFTSSPLPVELISFTGIKKEKYVQLNWKTSSEINNFYFTLERSDDGIHFTPATKITGAGTTSVVTNYSYNDYKYFNSVNYYRLNQTDYNGKEKYIGFIKVAVTAAENISMTVFPNPYSGGKLYMDLKGCNDNELTVKVTDDKGRELSRRQIVFEASQTRTTVFDSAADYAPGIYYITGTVGAQVIKNKILIR
jgi:hypothetical protein